MSPTENCHDPLHSHHCIGGGTLADATGHLVRGAAAAKRWRFEQRIRRARRWRRCFRPGAACGRPSADARCRRAVLRNAHAAGSCGAAGHAQDTHFACHLSIAVGGGLGADNGALTDVHAARNSGCARRSGTTPGIVLHCASGSGLGIARSKCRVHGGGAACGNYVGGDFRPSAPSSLINGAL